MLKSPRAGDFGFMCKIAFVVQWIEQSRPKG